MKHIFFIFLMFFSFLTYANQDLENQYWDCDYASTIRFVSLDEGAYCGKIYEVILKEKFNGSFKNFLNWWKENKEKEHNKRKQKN